mgnify:CR=1 FL=1
MTSRVKIGGASPKDPPKATKFEVIKDQGKVPFGNYKEIPTPNTAKGTVTRGTCRGMGAMLRGGEFTIN